MIDVEPKGLDLPKRELPKKLKYLEEKYSNPEIEISTGEMIEYYAWKSFAWIRGQVTHVVTKAIQMAIPKWFWFALIGAVVVIGLIIWLV
jgi:hypothetical protein